MNLEKRETQRNRNQITEGNVKDNHKQTRDLEKEGYK